MSQYKDRLMGNLREDAGPVQLVCGHALPSTGSAARKEWSRCSVHPGYQSLLLSAVKRTSTSDTRAHLCEPSPCHLAQDPPQTVSPRGLAGKELLGTCVAGLTCLCLSPIYKCQLEAAAHNRSVLNLVLVGLQGLCKYLLCSAVSWHSLSFCFEWAQNTQVKLR